MNLKITMTDEEKQKDAHSAVKNHIFKGLEEITEFIKNVNENISKSK